jgi:hypothetical protein
MNTPDTTMDRNQNTLAIRVIESLRNGVPANSAVRLLGSNQAHIEQAFGERLARSNGGEDSTGFFIEGPFGCGKSHELTNLRRMAFENNFACSIVCASKEMNLGTIAEVFGNAVRELRLPDKSVGGSCAEFLDRLNFNSRLFAQLLRNYAADDDTPVSLFGATIRLFEGCQSQADIIDSLIDFWDGGRCPFQDIKRDLKALGMPFKHLKAPTEATLGLPRLQFVTDLLVAAGYNGWIILIDEGEMIAKLSLLARAKAYANLASLFGSPAFHTVTRLVVAVAITNDLWHELLTERKDRHSIADRIATQKPALARAALEALDFLYDETKRLTVRPISSVELSMLGTKLAEIYSESYDGAAAPLPDTELSGSEARNVRSYLKEWITDWDLRRLYDGYVPQLSRRQALVDLSEDADYEAAEDTREE